MRDLKFSLLRVCLMAWCPRGMQMWLGDCALLASRELHLHGWLTSARVASQPHFLALPAALAVPLLTAPPRLACPHTRAGQQRGALLPSPVLRSAVLFRRPFYLYLMASNLVLRLGWLYRLSPHLRHHHAVVTLMVLVEAFR